MRESIKTAKTVEEAKQLAFAELGVSEDEASYEILEMPHRKWFSFIPAKVRVFIEEEEAPAPVQPALRKAAEKPAQTAPRRTAEKPAAPATPKAAEKPAAPAAPKAAEKPVPPAPVKEAPKAPAAKPEAKKPQPETAAPAPRQAAPEVSYPAPAAQSAPAPAPAARSEEAFAPIDLNEDEKARAAIDYLREVCTKMGAENITFEPLSQGEATIIRMEGDGAGMLIGHRGEVMEALNYLASLVADRSGGDYRKISLDVNHYRAKREANLEALARRIGAKVARTGRGHTLEPMNPYERRIIHSTISAMEGVRSESVGEGANRRVVITCTSPNARFPRAPRGAPGASRSSGPRAPRPSNRDSARAPRSGGGPRPPRSSTPPREFADRPRNPDAAPTVPRRTETIRDGADLPLYGKIEL